VTRVPELLWSELPVARIEPPTLTPAAQVRRRRSRPDDDDG
jgi:hypothetical protein